MKSEIDASVVPSPASGGVLKDLIAELCPKNRTVVSADNRWCLERLSQRLPLKLHRYPSGTEHATWVVPPQWDPVEAYISDGQNVIGSLKEHHMFLAPYSAPFEGWVTIAELRRHLRTSTSRPLDFVYEHRLASNHELRLKDWAISLPYERVQSLDKDRYFVKIDAKVQPGELLVAEHRLEGAERNTFALLAHTCHHGQANDGLAGVVVGTEIMRRLGERGGKLRFSYQLLVMPETIGSAVYLANNEDRLGDYLASLFLEMPGAGTHLTFNHSRRGSTYWDRLLGYVVRRADPHFHEYPFLRGMCNDELNFDWPAIGIPGLAIYWDGFPEYHTSADSPDIIDEGKLSVVVDTVLGLIDIIEADFVPSYTQKLPVYRSRYGLYIDFFEDKAQYQAFMDMLYAIDGTKTVFELADSHGIPFDRAAAYLEKWVQQGFIAKRPVPVSHYKGGPL